jgi:AcrR family transcriptional regulator
MRISGEERRQQILEVTLGVCAEKGFSGSTLDDIAEGAGVSRTLIVQHFGSKEGLYQALSEVVGRAHPLDEDFKVQRKMREKDDFGVFHACAEHVFENNLRAARQSNLRLTAFSMLEYPDLFEKFRRFRDEAWESVIDYVEMRQSEGALGAVDARNLVEGFKCTVVHLANEMIHREELPREERFYQVIDTVIHVMLAGLDGQG